MSDHPLILVADTEEAIRESIKLVLTDEGYHCHTVKDTQSLLRALCFYQYDLIIADIQIIHNDIQEISRELSHYSPKTSFLVTVGYERIGDMLHLMKFAVTEYLIKPFLFEELLERIKKAINGKAKIW